MKAIGIIANPASGKDIRRLVAYGSVFDNAEKTNIVKRILIALDALQVRDVFIVLLDIALIDIVVTDDFYAGAKAVWEVASLKEIFLSRTSPSSIGFSSLGGILGVTPSEDSKGTHIHIGAGGKEVLAPIAPGVIRRIPIASCRQFNLRDAIPINCDADNMIALDGEREINAYQGDKLTVRLNPEGPWVVDVVGVLSIASINKHFITIG